MRVVWILLIGHLTALVFGLAGILVALPNPELWIDSPYGPEIFRFGINYGGTLHIWLGALTILVFGGLTIGWRKTLIFFACATSISLTSELIGTSTGWPFGDYAYLDGLGWKVLGRVPYTIPLSWFYLGFAGYLLANYFAGVRSLRNQGLLAVAGGTYLLVIWDLVLDPAMAHEAMPLQFWTWHQSGPYFGMPLINFAGWALTGVLFMGLSRLAWRGDPAPSEYDPHVPLVVYLANIAFGVVLAIDVGLWIPALLALIFGAVPAAYGVVSRSASQLNATGLSDTATASVSYGVMARGAGMLLRRRTNTRVEGLGNVPTSGPVVVAARHYHHLYDGCVLVTHVPRTIHILVGLDWIRHGALRRVMEAACRNVGWPVVIRSQGPALIAGESAYSPREQTAYLRRATKASLKLLSDNQVLVVFPEAFPAIDPSTSPRDAAEEFGHFVPGVGRLVKLAQAQRSTAIPVVPLGFHYQRQESVDDRWEITARFGPARYLEPGQDVRAFVEHLEADVRRLSTSPVPNATEPVPAETASSTATQPGR